MFRASTFTRCRDIVWEVKGGNFIPPHPQRLVDGTNHQRLPDQRSSHAYCNILIHLFYYRSRSLLSAGLKPPSVAVAADAGKAAVCTDDSAAAAVSESAPLAENRQACHRNRAMEKDSWNASILAPWATTASETTKCHSNMFTHTRNSFTSKDDTHNNCLHSLVNLAKV